MGDTWNDGSMSHIQGTLTWRSHYWGASECHFLYRLIDRVSHTPPVQSSQVLRLVYEVHALKDVQLFQLLENRQGHW